MTDATPEPERNVCMSRGRKRRRQSVKPVRRDADLGDLAYRAQHTAVPGSGPAIQHSDKQVQDARGRIGSPFVVNDTLRALYNNGTIDDAELAAGRQFEEDFRLAQIDPLRAPDLSRVPGQGGSEITTATCKAKDRVWEALQSVGGFRSSLGRVLWHVLGEGMSLRQYAESSGGVLRNQTISALLKGALEIISTPKNS